MQACSPAFNQSGPARQIPRLWRVRDGFGLIERLRKALADLALRDARTQEVGPQEFAERRRVLCEATHPAQFASETSIRIVRQSGHYLGEMFVVVSRAVCTERMHPLVVLHHAPEDCLVQP